MGMKITAQINICNPVLCFPHNFVASHIHYTYRYAIVLFGSVIIPKLTAHLQNESNSHNKALLFLISD